MTKTIEVNEYISKFSEVKPQIDQALESLLEELVLINDGCSTRVIDQIVKYVKKHGVVCIVESKGAAALNRIFG